MDYAQCAALIEADPFNLAAFDRTTSFFPKLALLALQKDAATYEIVKNICNFIFAHAALVSAYKAKKDLDKVFKLVQQNYCFSPDSKTSTRLYIPSRVAYALVLDISNFETLDFWRPELVARAILGDGRTTIQHNLAVVNKCYAHECHWEVLPLFERVSSILAKKGGHVPPRHDIYEQTHQIIEQLRAMGHGVNVVSAKYKAVEHVKPCNPAKVLLYVTRLQQEHRAAVLLTCAMRFSHAPKKRRLAVRSLNGRLMGTIYSFLQTFPPKRLAQFVQCMKTTGCLFTEHMF